MTLPYSIVPTPGSQRPRSLAEALIASRETTSLPLTDETAFRHWAAVRGITDVDDPESHYDYRGAYRSGMDRAGNGHFTDQFKQHGHPTFSEESQYSSGHGDGGTWQGETFVPPDPAPADPNGADLPTIRDLNRRELVPVDITTGQAPKLADLLGGVSIPETLQRHTDRMRGFYGGVPIAGHNYSGYPGPLAPLPPQLGRTAADPSSQAGQGARALAQQIRPSVSDVTQMVPAPEPQAEPASVPMSVHPVDHAIEEALREPVTAVHPVDRAMAAALEEITHHSHRQPRDDAGQFVGPPEPIDSDGMHRSDDLEAVSVGEIE